MKKPLAWFLVLLCFAEFPLFAQQPAPASPPAPSRPEETQDEDSEGVVKIGTTLVQIDALVTDRDGKIVTDLTADDFEIFEDKKPQTISNFSFVDARLGEPITLYSKGVKPSSGTPIAPARIKPSQVKRTIVFVVDDVFFGAPEATYTRKALNQYIDTQIGPNDLVAILRTKSGTGVLQQLTNDQRVLRASVEKITPFLLNENSPVLSVLEQTIRNLKSVPGRKLVVLISPQLKRGYSQADLSSGANPGIASRREKTDSGITPKTETSPLDSVGGLGLDQFQRITELAVRSSVIISSVDPSGVSSVIDPEKDGLILLPKETGGKAFRNNNDLALGLRTVVERESGYYLIGYVPDQDRFDSKGGNRPFIPLTVRVKRPGLTVTTRKGFRAVSDEELQRQETPEYKLVAALASPFGTNQVRTRLTTAFLKDSPPDQTSKAGSIRSFIYFDANDLTFVDEPDGWKRAEVGIYSMLFDDNGEILKKIGRTQTLRLRGKTFEAALKNGFVFTLDLPVPKSGAFQIRAAVKDMATSRIGSASQFIQIPKLEKDRVALSGLVLTGLESRTAPNSSAQLTLSDAPSASPAVREFAQDGGLSVSCFVYNPVVHPQTKQPAVTAQIKLFKDGKEMYAGNSFNVPPTPSGVLELSRAIGFSSDFEPGEYSALVTVTDLYQTDSKRKTATQWLDFTVVAPQATNK